MKMLRNKNCCLGYISPDKNKRIFAFYEGHNKPATFIVKILSGGGNFLID